MRWPSRFHWPIVLVLFVGLAATGCGRQATPTPEPRTIQFIIYDYPSQIVASYQRLADEFHAAHPELTVEITPLSGSGSLQSALSAGADIVLSWGYALGDVGELRPLDPFIETEPADFLKDYPPRTIDAVRRQGQIIALPADLDVLVLYFDRDIFDQAGAPYPAPGWTWNDFVTTAQSVTQPLPEGGFQYGFYPSSALPSYLPFVAQEMAALWGDDLMNPQNLRLDSEAVVRAVQWYTDLALVHGVMPTPEQQRQQMVDPIVLGRAAMWVDWSSNRGGRQGGVEWKFPWGVAPLPAGSSGRSIAIMAMYAIPTSAKQPADAWRWISFLAGRTDQVNGLPVRPSLLQSPDLRKQLGEDWADVFGKAALDAFLASPGPEFNRYAGMLDQAVRTIFADGQPVEETLRKAQQRAEGGG